MRSLPLLVLFAAAGCPAPGNPQRVWIAQDGSEAMLKLVDSEPDPF